MAEDIPIEESKSWRRRYFTESGDPQGPISFDIKLRGPNHGLEGQKDYLTWYYCDFLEQQPAHNPVERDEVELGALLKWLASFKPRSRLDAYPMLMVAIEALHRFSSGFVSVEWEETIRLAARVRELEVLLAQSESERERERKEKEEEELQREETRLANPSVATWVDKEEEDRGWMMERQEAWKAEMQELRKVLEDTDKALKARNKDLIQANLQIRAHEKDLKATTEDRARIERLIEEMDEKHKQQQEQSTGQAHEWMLKSIMSSDLGTNFHAWAKIARRNKRLQMSYRKTMHLWVGVEIRSIFNTWSCTTERKILSRLKGKRVERRQVYRKKSNAFRKWEISTRQAKWENQVQRAAAHQRKVLLRDIGRWCFEEWRYVGFKIASLRTSFVTVWGRTKESLLATALLALKRNIFQSLKDRALATEKAHTSRPPPRASRQQQGAVNRRPAPGRAGRTFDGPRSFDASVPQAFDGGRSFNGARPFDASGPPAPAFGEEGWRAAVRTTSVPAPPTPAAADAALRPEGPELFLKSIHAASSASRPPSRAPCSS